MKRVFSFLWIWASLLGTLNLMADVPTAVKPTEGLPEDLSGPQYLSAIRIAKQSHQNIGVAAGLWSNRYFIGAQFNHLVSDALSVGISPMFLTGQSATTSETGVGALATFSFFAFSNRPFGGLFINTGVGVVALSGLPTNNGEMRLMTMLGAGWSHVSKMGFILELGMASIQIARIGNDTGALVGALPAAFSRINYSF